MSAFEWKTEGYLTSATSNEGEIFFPSQNSVLEDCSGLPLKDPPRRPPSVHFPVEEWLNSQPDGMNKGRTYLLQVELQTLETRQRGFVIFDRSENRDTVMLCPDTLKKSSQGKFTGVNNTHFKDPLASNVRGNEKSISRVEERVNEAGTNAKGLRDVECLAGVNLPDYSDGGGGCHDDESDSDWHENTEEIDALLSSDSDSDSETSTARSPMEMDGIVSSVCIKEAGEAFGNTDEPDNDEADSGMVYPMPTVDYAIWDSAKEYRAQYEINVADNFGPHLSSIYTKSKQVSTESLSCSSCKDDHFWSHGAYQNILHRSSDVSHVVGRAEEDKVIQYVDFFH